MSRSVGSLARLCSSIFIIGGLLCDLSDAIYYAIDTTCPPGFSPAVSFDLYSFRTQAPVGFPTTTRTWFNIQEIRVGNGYLSHMTACDLCARQPVDDSVMVRLEFHGNANCNGGYTGQNLYVFTGLVSSSPLFLFQTNDLNAFLGVSKLLNGMLCASDSSCHSGICRARCCSGSHCATCRSGDGNCEQCDAGYYISNAQCFQKKAIGAICGSDGECSSNICRTACCTHQNCVACSLVTGACATCQTGYYESGGACYLKKANGAACSFSGQCTSLFCSTNCCPHNKCTKCLSDGTCGECTSGYYLSGSKLSCSAQAVDGGACGGSEQCKGLDCRGGRCCGAKVQFECVACNSAGKCSRCDGSLVLTTQGLCVTATTTVSKRTRSLSSSSTHTIAPTLSFDLTVSNTSIMSVSHSVGTRTPTASSSPSHSQTIKQKNRNHARVVILFGDIISGVGGTVVAGSARGFGALGTISTAASTSVKLSSFASTLGCGVVEDGDGGDDSYLEHPIPGPNIFPRPLSGSVVIQFLIFVVLPLIVLPVLHIFERNRERSESQRSRSYTAGFVCSVFLAYFAPVASNDAATLLTHPDANATSVAVGVICLACVLGFLCSVTLKHE